MQRAFRQVDVFTDEPYRGNPVAVVLDADGLSTAQMQRIANWTNLSETTFVLPPSDPAADYQVRIFTPSLELPFAGHPTLGSCHAWQEVTGNTGCDRTVQQCAAGLITVQRSASGRLAFAAPPLLRSGPVDEAELVEVAGLLGVERAAIVDAAWADNGPGWMAVELASAEAVLALRPTDMGPRDVGVVGRKVGAVGAHAAGEPALEVRAFFPKDGATAEDPVTGSLNASLAQWLLGSGKLTAPYVASQGTVLGRAGRVYVDQDPDGTIWVGGGTVTCVSGVIDC
jgi:PhzF family phenazine biosynthesis protein